MSERALIRPRDESGAASKPGPVTVARGLPLDLLRDAARRLAATSALVGLAFLVALILNHVVRAAGWYAPPHPLARDVIAATMILVSLAMSGLARSGRLDTHLLLDLGLVYEVVVAFGISMGDNLAPLSSDRPLEAISWLCVWIAVYPLVVPANPWKTTIAAFAAASTWPLAFLIGVLFVDGEALPAIPIVAMNVLENYLAVLVALVAARIITKLGVDVQKARRMGSYELVERIDSGGMGDVWRARHQMLARPAAIKLIRPGALGANDAGEAKLMLRRFEREAQATAALHSPHTIALYDYGVTEDGTFYYVMELLEGLDLESLIKRFGPVPAERAVHFLLQACDSLADAHGSDLIHRDIKPANIYACHMGRVHDFVKVLDFGLVRPSWRDEHEGGRLTREGTASGTPAYMAPEVVLGKREVDARVDLYALGCVAYWLVTGKLVFEGENAMELALHHAHTRPVPPSRRTELPIPASLERLILGCLEKEPGARPESADEIVRELSCAACEIGESWTPERARRWWEAHRPRPELHPPEAALADLATVTRSSYQ